MSTTHEAAAETRTYSVHLIDGNSFHGITAVDELDAELGAGLRAGQDVGHLVREVVEDEEEN